MVMVKRDLDPRLVARTQNSRSRCERCFALQGLQVEAILSRATFDNQPYNASAMSFYRWI